MIIKQKLTKVFNLGLIVLMLAFTCLGLTACFEAVGKPIYTRYGDHYEVTGVSNKNAEKVTIAASYNNLPVTVIGDHAFQDCFALKEVTIPETITRIGNAAFLNCSDLKALALPEALTEIGDDALSGLHDLTSITLPANLTTIGKAAFCWCSELQSITIPDSVTSIGDAAFESCLRLQSVTLPSGLTKIGKTMFQKCGELQSITLPDGVTSIDEYAFAYCEKLTTINIPDGVTTIGRSAFMLCKALNNLTFPDTLTTISDTAFQNCDKLTAAHLPNGLTSLGIGAFGVCPALTDVTIGTNITHMGRNPFGETPYGNNHTTDGVTYIGPNNMYLSFCTPTKNNELHISATTKLIADQAGKDSQITAVIIDDNTVTTIGDQAFYNCDALTTVTIGVGITNFGTEVFAECNQKLATVTIGSNMGEKAFYNCYSITTLEIKDTVTEIAPWAFAFCGTTSGWTPVGLSSVTIPDSVTKIGELAFDYCKNLSLVRLGTGLVEIGYRAFDVTKLSSNGNVYFAKGCFDGWHCVAKDAATNPQTATVDANKLDWESSIQNIINAAKLLSETHRLYTWYRTVA